MTDRLTIDGERAWWGLFTTEPHHGPEQWAYRFEQVLPFPVEQLACAFTRLEDDRILAVGVLHSDVEAHLVSPHAATAWALIPDRIPEFLCAQGVPPSLASKLNLFSGNYAAHPLRRLRRWILGCWLAGCGAVSILILIGGQLRIATIEQACVTVDKDRRALAEKAVPASVTGQQLPPEIRLQQAIRQRQGRTGEAQIITDQMVLLDQLWTTWPNQPAVRLRDISANSRQISAKITLLANSDLAALMAPLTAITTGPGLDAWKLNPPDLPALTGGETTLVLTWQPSTVTGKSR